MINEIICDTIAIENRIHVERTFFFIKNMYDIITRIYVCNFLNQFTTLIARRFN